MTSRNRPISAARMIRAARLMLAAGLLLAACGPAPASNAASAAGGSPAVGSVTPGGSALPPTAAFGAAPLYAAPTALEGEPPADEDAAALLQTARAALRQARSFRLWIAHSGDGAAAADLEPGLPQITAGVWLVGEPPAARWSITNLAGFPGRTIEYAFVDGQAWSDSGVSAWAAIPPGPPADVVRQDAESMAPEGLFAWSFLDESLVLEAAGLDRLGAETAIRFEAVSPGEVRVPPWWSSLQGRTERFALWVSERGVPLQVEVSGTVRDGATSGTFAMTLQVAGIDDERNRVAAPG